MVMTANCSSSPYFFSDNGRCTPLGKPVVPDEYGIKAPSAWSPIADQAEGAFMPYSSGTTGFPKGVQRPLSEKKYGEEEQFAVMTILYGATKDSIFLSPAPLYHSAPLGFCMTSIRNGITVVVMEHFEPEFALQCVEEFRITHAQWVPTMFVRMLKLPKEVRARYDVSSQRYAIHGAAPCAVPIKEQMIEWWGEIL